MTGFSQLADYQMGYAAGRAEGRAEAEAEVWKRFVAPALARLAEIEARLKQEATGDGTR